MHPGRHPGRIKPPPTRRAYSITPVVLPVERGAARHRGVPGDHPSKRQQRPNRRAYLVNPVAPPVIPPGSGTVGAGTFLLSLQPGTKLTYSWQTTVIPSYSGREQRESTVGSPRRRFQGGAFLADSGMRDVAGQLQRSAASGATFLLALPMEQLPVTADSLTTVVAVGDTTGCDWNVLNQRCVVIGIDGTQAAAVVQSSTATTITIALTNTDGSISPTGVLGATGRAGAIIMPLLQVLLDPTQGFGRYPIGVGMWSLNATASVFGFAGADSMGVGTEIVTLTAGEAVPVGDLVENDLMIWDRINESAGTSNEAMTSRTELVDLGGVPFAIGGAAVPDWQRSIRLRSTTRDDWQWFKAFVRQLRGMQRPFLLSTNRPDLVYLSTISGGIKVSSASASGGNDYVSWFASDAHKRLAITAGGVVQYATVTLVTDDGDGTLSLLLDATTSGSVTKVSFLEQVRLSSDEVEVGFDGAEFVVDLQAVTVQELVVPPGRFLFDTVVATAFHGNNPPGSPTDHREILVGLGSSTVVNYTSDFITIVGGIPVFDFISGQFGALTAATGNVDGMVVMMPSQVDGSTTTTLYNEDTAFAATSRFRLPAGFLNTVRGSHTVIYCGAISRWVVIQTSSS